MNVLIQTIDGIQEILAICPCCGEIFRLVEGKFLFPQKRQRTCDYMQVVSLENEAYAAEDQLLDLEQAFKEDLEKQRSHLQEIGRKQARTRLMTIDPVFSGNDINPQDVKAIMDPVEYIIFHGHKSDDGCGCVELVSRSPIGKKQETITSSIQMAIERGNVEFETLRMKNDGSFDITVA
jgi:predicted Holliday junction resolvase-like endonuclease